jgi:TRAP-type C4-dicarboxylate transport system permease small subunit
MASPSRAEGPSGPVARVERALAGLLRSIAGATMLVAIGVNFANVVARYVFLRPFPWAEETMQFLDVWMVMLGAAVITRNAEHLRMDALYHFVPAWARRGLDVLSVVVGVAISLYVVVQSVDVVAMLTRTGQRSVIARIPMNAMYMSVLLGFAFAALFPVLAWRRRRNEARDPAGIDG